VAVVAGAPEEAGATEEEACATDEEAAGTTNEEAGAVKRGRWLVFFILLQILLPAPENNVTHKCQILTFRMRNIHDQSFKLFGKKGKKNNVPTNLTSNS